MEGKERKFKSPLKKTKRRMAARSCLSSRLASQGKVIKGW